jgi:hypothetical protein
MKGGRVTILSKPEDIIEECKCRADECYALLESTTVPEYRQALAAMAKAWTKIAKREGKILANQRTGSDAGLLADVLEFDPR